MSGIIGGMGIGGGSVLIPSLTCFFDVAQKQAQSTNLITFIPTAISALVVHIKNKRLAFGIALPIIGFGLIGAVGGSLLSVYFNQELLRKVFGVFMCLIGVWEVFFASKKSSIEKKK